MTTYPSSGLPSNNSGFSRVWLQNRENFAKSCLDMQAFRRLSKLVEACQPDIVIMAARRMPRTWQLLKQLDSSCFAFNAEFYSDFAIEFLGDRLRDANVAIVDDTVNAGSTFKNIMARVSSFAPGAVSCFALAQKTGGGAAFSGKSPVRRVFAETWSNKAYRSCITSLSRALWILNTPLELEFPIYKFKVEKPFLDALPARLQQAFPQLACHRLDIAESYMIGLNRYTVDLEPGRLVNNKLRINADLAKCELAVAPMAHCAPCGDDAAAWRAERFKASMRLFADCAASLGLPADAVPDRDEARLLFAGPYEKFALEARLNPSQDYLTDFYQSDWPKFRHDCKPQKPWSLDSCFVAFFKALADYVEENTGTDYQRLCKGPTFGELQLVMAELWQSASRLSPPQLHSLLSRLLDEHIDHGFIVPVLDSQGCRRFRKGEPFPWLGATVQMLASMGVKAEPQGNLEQIAANLPKASAGRLEHMEKMLEERAITFCQNA